MAVCPFVRALALAVAFGSVAIIVGEIALLCDLYPFEREPILQLLGYRGLAIILVLNSGLLLLTARAVYVLRNRSHPFPVTTNVLLLLAALSTLWVLEYMFMERPLTVHLALLARLDDVLVTTNSAEEDFAHFSLAQRISDAESLHRLKSMYERIHINNVDAYARHPIGATIDKYAERYDTDPALLFFLNYIDSFYGEAVSGPVPFVHSMTAETIRDIVQIHLPGWFVESDARRALISSSLFNRTFGEALGFKLRYAVHKATLDVSVQPYALNTYSDIFLILNNYPDEFPEILSDGSRDAVIVALRDSFRSLRGSALVPPYEQPYGHATFSAAYYESKREDLKRFARSAFYLALRDFDFTTRVQALLSKYQRDYYISRLGSEEWGRIPRWQQVAMLAMIRDLYTPNVGRPAYNRYALPELNCTPLEFVASAAVSNPELSDGRLDAVWRPKDFAFLWGGATYRLRVLNEVWALVHGAPMPGLGIEDTAGDARGIVWL